MQLQQPTPKFITTVFDLEVVKDGQRSPWSVPCATLSEARELAATRSRSSGLPIIELDWRTDFKNETRDGVFICEIRRDQAQTPWKRVFA
jgi:hypothetical protein